MLISDENIDQFDYAKKQVSGLVASMIERGIPEVSVMAALFSVAGNVMGLNWQPDEWDGLLETAKTPIIADAKRARKFKKHFAS